MCKTQDCCQAVCLPNRTAVKLSCHKVEQMWFDVMRSYPGVGQFLSPFSLLAMVLYFITTSDSGSLVIDCLSANGDPDPPRFVEQNVLVLNQKFIIKV